MVENVLMGYCNKDNIKYFIFILFNLKVIIQLLTINIHFWVHILLLILEKLKIMGFIIAFVGKITSVIQ